MNHGVRSNLYSLENRAELLKRCWVAVLDLAQHVFEVRDWDVVFESPDQAADFERNFLA